jgi:TusA-related sulfurtransferase
MADAVIDAKGLKCPMPIVHIAREIKILESGQTVEITSDDPAFCADVEAFCRVSGNTLEDLCTIDGVYYAVVCKC